MKNYGNVIFSKEEKEQLIKHRDAICDWIKVNVIPYMRDGSKIEVDFGGKYLGMRSINETTNYHLYIYQEPKWFCGDCSCGIPDRTIQIGFSQKYGHVNSFLEETFPYYIMPVIDNWQEIKRDMANKLLDQRRINGKIKYFEV